MIERIRKDDYLYGFWLTKGGNTFWLIRRDEQLIIQGYANMTRHINIVVPYESEGQVKIASEMIKQFFCVNGNGEEYLVFDSWARASSGLGKLLDEQFKIFDATIRQINSQLKENPVPSVDEGPETEDRGEIGKAVTPLLERIKVFNKKRK